jgi:hypothetical protein
MVLCPSGPWNWRRSLRSDCTCTAVSPAARSAASVLLACLVPSLLSIVSICPSSGYGRVLGGEKSKLSGLSSDATGTRADASTG